MCDAHFLKRFRAPSNVVKYNSKSNPSIWMKDYRLACSVGGADDDLFINQFLPIYLADSTRASLDHLLRNIFNDWEDLKEIFMGNFQGTYVWLGNPWDLKSCQKKLGESLRDYIRCFSQKCHEHPRVADADAILAFWSNMICRTLGHELGHDQSSTTKELLDIATWDASSERRWGLSSFWATQKQSTATTKQHHPKLMSRMLEKAPSVTGRGRSSTPDALQWLPVMTAMTRKQTTPTRSMSRPWSLISSAMHGSQRTISKNFSK
jgi:hypothetical protein